MIEPITDGSDMPSVRFYRPSPLLADLVTSFYVVETHKPLLDYLHPEWGNIRLTLKGRWMSRPIDGPTDPVRPATLFGPTDRTRIVDASAGLLIGIGLTPLGWVCLIGADAAQCANDVRDLGDALGINGETLIEQLIAQPDEERRIAIITAQLETIAGRWPSAEPMVTRIHEELIARDHNSAVLLAEATGLPGRTLHRLCLRAFGFAPKRLLRRQRFLRTLAMVSDHLDQPLSAILGAEYYDQSHFNRDFLAYMGMSPTAYFNLPRKALRRAAIERRRLIGASLQGLHAAPAPIDQGPQRQDH